MVLDIWNTLQVSAIFLCFLSCFFWSFFDRIKGMKLYKAAHTVYKTQYHIVWITRFRRKILLKGVKDYLKIKLLEIRRYDPDWEYLEIGIDIDHIHLYMLIPHKYAVSKAVEAIKSNTSRAPKQKFTFLQKVYWDDKGIWAKGYFVYTVRINEKIIQAYVKMQEEKIQDKQNLKFESTTTVKV